MAVKKRKHSKKPIPARTWTIAERRAASERDHRVFSGERSPSKKTGKPVTRRTMARRAKTPVKSGYYANPVRPLSRAYLIIRHDGKTAYWAGSKWDTEIDKADSLPEREADTAMALMRALGLDVRKKSVK